MTPSLLAGADRPLAGNETWSPTNRRDYVIYAPTAWDSPRQPAHNLADALAVDHRVLYVDPPLSPLSPIRYGVRRVTWARTRSMLDRRVRRTGGLCVFAPLVLPPIEHPWTRARSLPVLRAQVRHAVARAKLERPVVLAWRGLPQLAGVAEESLRAGVIMDHPTAGAELMGRDSAELEAEMAATCGAAELILTTSRPMHALLTEQGWKNELVPFGFPVDLAESFDRAREPCEYAELKRPLLGYTGGIDDRLDYELIVKLADRFSQGSLVFVGAVSPRLSAAACGALRSRANIHLLGPRSRTALPGYIRHLDVALMPYEDNLFTRHQSPMKLWEYLYAGPPIVGVGCDELSHFASPLVNYADSPEEMPAQIEQALRDPSAGREQRRHHALANTWTHRANQLDALIEGRLSGVRSEVPG